ncbi:hypothetical protein Tco_0783271 [Tanacetum coccineum]
MADQRTMAELLQAPIEGYGDAIVIPAILPDNFKLKHGLTLNLMSTNASTSGLSPDVAALTDAVKALLLKNITHPPTSVKAVEESCVTCGGPHPYYQCLATDGNTFPGYQDNIQTYVYAAAVIYNQGNARHCRSECSLPSNTVVNPKNDLKVITTRSGVSYDGPPIPPPFYPYPKVVEREPEPNRISRSFETQQPKAPRKRRPSNDEVSSNLSKLTLQSTSSMLTLYASNITSSIQNPSYIKEKLFELANTPVNENCSAVILKKLPEKLGDPGKFLIPCNFPEIVECLALADLGASINLMPLSIWNEVFTPQTYSYSNDS